MTNVFGRLVLAVMLICSAASVQGQEKMTEHTVKLGADAKSPHSTIADVAWLAGHWAGPALGGEAEEIWSPPKAGSMMGMYRLVRDGKVVFYELLTLAEEGGSLVLRLKHFNPDLTGWEEKQQTVYLAIEGKNGALREEAFRYSSARSKKQ